MSQSLKKRPNRCGIGEQDRASVRCGCRRRASAGSARNSEQRERDRGAGMDGALPTLVGGLVAAPVIAVPTSVGYGTGLGGTAALMTMLNACAPGIAVVNIDNGFGAGYMAHLINTRVEPPAVAAG